MKKTLIIAMAALMLLTFASTSYASENDGSIVIGMDADATSLDPRFVTTANGMYVTSQIYNGLIKLNKNLEYVPDLATFENPTKTEYVFNLKKGVEFHDGHELTAEDVKYTFESMLDPDVGSPKSGNYKNLVGAEEFSEGEAEHVEGIEIIDDYTVKFEVKEPFAPFMVNMNIGIVPKHIAQDEEKSLDENPVGTGPFEFSEREVDQETVLVANEDYFEGRPNLDKAIYKIVPESSVGVVELETGAIDVLMSVTEDDRRTIEKNEEIVLSSIAGTNYQYVGFNVTKEPVDNKYLRKAIAYSLDKEAITSHFNGSRTVVPLPTSSSLAQEYAEDPSINKYEYSYKKAQEMLEKADYDGEEITIKTSSGREELAQIMQQYMKAAGINADIELLEWGTFYEDVKQGRAEIYLLGWYGIIDPDGYWFFHSEMTPPKGGVNRMYYKNDKVDELIEEGRRTLDPEARKEVYREMYQIITDEVPMIFLYSIPDLAAYRKGIEGFEAAPYPVTILHKLKDVKFSD
ncbi:MAG: ABC transporter substrate-binding protein [Bacillota bacterium]